MIRLYKSYYIAYLGIGIFIAISAVKFFDTKFGGSIPWILAGWAFAMVLIVILGVMFTILVSRRFQETLALRDQELRLRDYVTEINKLLGRQKKPSPIRDMLLLDLDAAYLDLNELDKAKDILRNYRPKEGKAGHVNDLLYINHLFSLAIREGDLDKAQAHRDRFCEKLESTAVPRAYVSRVDTICRYNDAVLDLKKIERAAESESVSIEPYSLDAAHPEAGSSQPDGQTEGDTEAGAVNDEQRRRLKRCEAVFRNVYDHPDSKIMKMNAAWCLAKVRELEGDSTEARRYYRYVADNGGDLYIREESRAKL